MRSRKRYIPIDNSATRVAKNLTIAKEMYMPEAYRISVRKSAKELVRGTLRKKDRKKKDRTKGGIMVLTVILEKKKKDGRIWIHMRRELIPDGGYISTDLPFNTCEAKKMEMVTLSGAMPKLMEVKDPECVSIHGNQGLTTVRRDSATFKVLEGLESVDGLTAVTVSRYALAIDKGRAFSWEELIPEIIGALKNALGCDIEISVQSTYCFRVDAGNDESRDGRH